MKNLLKIITLLITVIIASVSPPVLALSSEQKRVFQSGVYYFDVKTSDFSSCSAGSGLTGADNIEKAYNYFVGPGKDLAAIHAAGIVGNLDAESGGVNPLATNSAGYHGIAQWDPKVRLPRLREFATTSSPSRDPDDLATQLDFIWEELHTTRKALPQLQATTTARDAAIAWEKWYEGSGGALMTKRIQKAEATFAKYGSNTITSADSATCTDGSGDIVGGYSLPLDRKWYDEHPTYFTKPHHDYPAADIPVPSGTAVYSMTAGKIIKAPVGGKCGIGVMIDAGNGITFMYCHGLDGGAVTGAKQGDTVQAGSMIMHSGSTGQSSGPHLHLEIDINRKNVCPQNLFVGIANGAPPSINALPTSGCTN